MTSFEKPVAPLTRDPDLPVDLTPLAEVIRNSFRPRRLDFNKLEANDTNRIGVNLRRSRTTLQLSQAAMAEMIGVSRTQYRNLEEGRHHLRLQQTAQYMVSTGIPLHYLFQGSCYDPLFAGLVINHDWLPLQSFVGRCSDALFEALVTLVAGQLPGPPPKAPVFVYTWPEDAVMNRELEVYYRIIGEGIYQLRQIVEISQDDLGELLGITGPTLAAYERNRVAEPRGYAAHMAMRLWAATGINPLWITCGSHFHARRCLQHLRMEYLRNLLQGQSDSLLLRLQASVSLLPGYALTSSRTASHCTSYSPAAKASK